MATTLQKYDHTHKILCGAGDWTSNTIKLALIDSYTYMASDTIFGDYLEGGVEVEDASYTAGGKSLTGKTKTDSVLDADNIGWPALTASFNAGLLYISGTVEGLVNPLLACIIFDTVGGTVSITGDNFNVLWNAGGIFTI